MIFETYGNSTNVTNQALDAAAAVRADEMADAKSGRELYRQLEAKWHGEGRQLFLDGDSILSCWNNCQEEGYREAEAEYEAIVQEADRKPELGVDYEPVSVQYVWGVI